MPPGSQIDDAPPAELDTHNIKKDLVDKIKRKSPSPEPFASIISEHFNSQ